MNLPPFTNAPLQPMAPQLQIPPQLQSNNSSTQDLNSEDLKYKKKYQDVKEQVKFLEKSNEELIVKMAKTKKLIERLKFERKLLFERLDQVESENNETTQAQNAAPVAEPPPETDDSDASEAPTRKRKKRDPNAPKKPPNAFFMFCQIGREEMKNKYPEMARSEVTKQLSIQWKAMSEEDKKQYYDLYEKDKERYNDEYAKYTAHQNLSATSVNEDRSDLMEDNE